jgi:hypothetical protein
MAQLFNFNLDREFVYWFYENEYPQLGSNRAAVMQHAEPLNVMERDYWMRQAYKAGAKVVATETICVLGAWAAGCAGLDPELVCPDEVYDRAQENLFLYYDELELFK